MYNLCFIFPDTIIQKELEISNESSIKKIKQIPLAHIAFHTVENESTTLLEFICVYFSFLGFLLLQVLTIGIMGGYWVCYKFMSGFMLNYFHINR